MQLIRPKILVLATLVAVGASAVQAADFSDTYLAYRYGSDFREPNNPNDVSKNILQFTHVSNYKYGSNFVNVDALLSDDKDKANNSAKGAAEIYLTYRHQLSLGKITDMKTQFGPVRDLALTAGFDLNAKDTTFAPRKRELAIGPTINMAIFSGFLDVGVFYYRESNHRGIPGTLRPDITFDPTYLLGAVWRFPFQIGSAPLKFQGFLNYTGKKGLDYQNVQTEPETLMRTSLMIDVGQLALAKKNTVWLGIGYEYWHNKFGNKPGVGTRTSTPLLQAEFHF